MAYAIFNEKTIEVGGFEEADARISKKSFEVGVQAEEPVFYVDKITIPIFFPKYMISCPFKTLWLTKIFTIPFFS